MPHKTCQRFALLFLLALLSSPFASSASARDVPGEILVHPLPGRAAAIRQHLDQHGHAVLEVDDYSGLLRIRVPVGHEQAAIVELTATGNTRFAERNGIGRGGLVPNDTYFPEQWHLRNNGGGGGVVGADIACVPAWEIATGSANTVIAVLDTGIDSDHPEFAGRIDPDGFDFVNEDSNPEADHAHGTWVSGCIAAIANNNFAVTGVDHACRILPVKVLAADNSGTTFDLIQGINYAAAQPDVQIISMSLIQFPGSGSLLAALSNARLAGKILIACAGNGGIGNADTSYPGAALTTISVGATTRSDQRASFSGTGARLDFVAPGEDITTVRHNSGGNLRTVVSGCSFATPITAGVVGLLLARAEELGVSLDHDTVRTLLQVGAEDEVGSAAEDRPGRDDFFGEGRINAHGALMALNLQFGCTADIDDDGNVGFGDLLALLSHWGTCADCPEDLNINGIVDFNDLLTLLGSWGPCV